MVVSVTQPGRSPSLSRDLTGEQHLCLHQRDQEDKAQLQGLAGDSNPEHCHGVLCFKKMMW